MKRKQKSADLKVAKPALAMAEEYERARGVLRKHQNAAAAGMSRAVFRGVARKLGVLEGIDLILESESQLSILIDQCVYGHRQAGKTIVEEYLAGLPPTKSSVERAVRAAMGQARYAAYRIDGRMEGVGIKVSDVATGEEFFVRDVGFSLSGVVGQYLAGRLIPMPGYWMTTGAMVPVSKEVAKGVDGAGEKLAIWVIGVAIEEGWAMDIKYI